MKNGKKKQAEYSAKGDVMNKKYPYVGEYTLVKRGEHERLIFEVENLKKQIENAEYILVDSDISKFSETASKETNPEKMEALLMSFVQEHFQFKVEE